VEEKLKATEIELENSKNKITELYEEIKNMKEKTDQ